MIVGCCLYVCRNLISTPATPTTTLPQHTKKTPPIIANNPSVFNDSKNFSPPHHQIRGAFCYINSAKFGSRCSVRLNSRTAEVSHISTCNNNVPLIWVIRTHMYIWDKKIKVRKIALISVVSVCGETKFRIISQMCSIYELLAQDVVYYIWELEPVWRGKAMSVTIWGLVEWDILQKDTRLVIIFS